MLAYSSLSSKLGWIQVRTGLDWDRDSGWDSSWDWDWDWDLDWDWDWDWHWHWHWDSERKGYPSLGLLLVMYRSMVFRKIRQ